MWFWWYIERVRVFVDDPASNSSNDLGPKLLCRFCSASSRQSLSRAITPGIKRTTVTRIATPGGPFPVSVGAFQTPRPHEGPQVMTVTRILTLGGPFPVTVWTFEMRRKHEEPKVTTVTSMAALRRQKRRVTRIATSRGPILVTVGTFERFGLGTGGTIPSAGSRIPRPGTCIQ